MTYDEALKYLQDLEPRGWRLGLDRMKAFADAAGLSENLGGDHGPKYLHVAGTNGKGSVTAFLQAMLIESGFRTGAFFSPYVVDPRERVWFGRDMISKPDFVESVERLRPIVASLEGTEFGGVTEFELKTAIGFDHWMRKQAEYVALEVGLGGRFDSTNIVTPAASAIVSIGLDHTQILGDTLEKIAFEKAGIIKYRRPVVVGQMLPGPADVITAVAQEAQAPLLRMGQELILEQIEPRVWRITTPHSSVILRPSLYGDIQGHNSALAYAAFEAAGVGSGQSVADGVSKAWIPGRFQLENIGGHRVVFDGAHNSESAAVLLRSLETYREEAPFSRIILVAGMVAGHEPASFFDNFRGRTDSIHLAPIQFHRAISPQTLRAAICGTFNNVVDYPTLEEALSGALKECGPTDIVVVTGSFYLVGEALRGLQTLS